jgi:polyphosphate glucokinase
VSEPIGVVAHALGIDIGGSGMKAAPVDLELGSPTVHRRRIPTPQPATPEAMAPVVRELAKAFSWSGPIGCTYPGIVKRGVVGSAANLDPSWIGVDIDGLLTEATGCPVTVINDADAAGIAEMRFGAGAGQRGVVVMVTLGTGIGTALFVDGTLVPNTELGHIEVRGRDAEQRASAAVRETKHLSWQDWAGRVDEYLHRLAFLLSPVLYIVGGGVSDRADRWFPFLTQQVPVVAARLANRAGIVGAALLAPR